MEVIHLGIQHQRLPSPHCVFKFRCCLNKHSGSTSYMLTKALGLELRGTWISELTVHDGYAACIDLQSRLSSAL